MLAHQRRIKAFSPGVLAVPKGAMVRNSLNLSSHTPNQPPPPTPPQPPYLRAYPPTPSLPAPLPPPNPLYTLPYPPTPPPLPQVRHPHRVGLDHLRGGGGRRGGHGDGLRLSQARRRQLLHHCQLAAQPILGPLAHRLAHDYRGCLPPTHPGDPYPPPLPPFPFYPRRPLPDPPLPLSPRRPLPPQLPS